MFCSSGLRLLSRLCIRTSKQRLQGLDMDPPPSSNLCKFGQVQLSPSHLILSHVALACLYRANLHGKMITQAKITPHPHVPASHAYSRQSYRRGPKLVPRKRIRRAICANAQFAPLIHRIICQRQLDDGQWVILRSPGCKVFACGHDVDDVLAR